MERVLLGLPGLEWAKSLGLPGGKFLKRRLLIISYGRWGSTWRSWSLHDWLSVFFLWCWEAFQSLRTGRPADLASGFKWLGLLDVTWVRQTYWKFSVNWIGAKKTMSQRKGAFEHLHFREWAVHFTWELLIWLFHLWAFSSCSCRQLGKLEFAGQRKSNDWQWLGCIDCGRFARCCLYPVSRTWWDTGGCLLSSKKTCCWRVQIQVADFTNVYKCVPYVIYNNIRRCQG